MFDTLFYWANLQHSQWFNTEKLIRLQSEKLKKLVVKSYEDVPLYRRLYEKAMVDRLKVLGKSALDGLPVVSRSELVRIPLDERRASSIRPDT
ncbi:MAG: hypothetical protein QXY84_00245 [Candidatus Caldarchaeum sp.]